MPARCAFSSSLLTTTALVSTLAALPAAGQDCASTPPDVNCIIYENPGQAGTDDTGESLGDVAMTFSPPTAFNGDSNDAGIRWGLFAGSGGDAGSSNETGGTGGAAGDLTLTINPGVTVEGSTLGGAIDLVSAGDAAGGAYYGIDNMPTAATGGAVFATLNGVTTASSDTAVHLASGGGAGPPATTAASSKTPRTQEMAARPGT